MKTDFKFGDKVTHVGHKNTYGVILSTDGYNATVYYSSTDTPRLPLEELKPYVDTSITSITRVMDALGIKKDVPIDVYTKTPDMGYPHNPYVFDGETFIDDTGYLSLDVLSDIVLKGAYFKLHNSSISFPPNGHIYWYVTPKGEVKYVIWNETTWDYALKLMDNVFKTEVEAKCHVTEMLAKYREVM